MSESIMDLPTELRIKIAVIAVVAFVAGFFFAGFMTLGLNAM